MSWLKAIYVDYKRGTCLVKSNKTGRSFPITLKKDIRYLVNQGDWVKVIKSTVTGQWNGIDYMAMFGGDLQ